MHENKTKFERNHSLEYYPMTCIRNIQAKEVYWPRYLNLACERQTFLLTHRRWGTFREEERLRLSDRIPYWWRKSGSHGVPNANLFNFTILLVDFVLRSFCILSCVHLRTSSSKTQMLLLEKNIFHGYCLFCYRFIAFILPSVLFLSFVNNGETNVTCLVLRPHFSSLPKCFRSRDPCENVKNVPRPFVSDTSLKRIDRDGLGKRRTGTRQQCNYSNVQWALMTGFRTDFTSLVWNFCRWVADVPPRETSLIGDERGETSAVRRLTLTAHWFIVCRLQGLRSFGGAA